MEKGAAIKGYKVCCFQGELFSHSKEGVLTVLRKQLTWARDQGIQLVVFPQFWGLNLICPEAPEQGGRLLDYLRQTGQKAGQLFIATCSQLSREFGLYLLPGSLLELAAISAKTTHKIPYHNRAYLFSPRGELVLTQDQTHFSPWEEQLLLQNNPGAPPVEVLSDCPYLHPGESLSVVNSPLGKLGIVIGTDAFYPEVSRILTLQGAEVLLALTALPQPFNPWRQVAGMWQQVQQNQTLCVEACLVGNFLSSTFAGKSSLYGPCEITTDETGVLQQAASATEPTQVVGRFSIAALAELRSQYPLSQHYNLPLYRQELGKVYVDG
jgi:predicted amidohydrolase